MIMDSLFLEDSNCWDGVVGKGLLFGSQSILPLIRGNMPSVADLPQNEQGTGFRVGITC